MPMYDYTCTKCGHTFEEIVPHFDTEATTECPKCGSPAKFAITPGSRDGVKLLFNYMEP